MLRKYSIHEEGRPCVGYLYYDEDTEKYALEAIPEMKNDSLPAFLICMFEAGRLRLEGYIAKRFVQERVVPPNRQGIGFILKAAGFDYYDEILFIDKFRGRCDKDDFLIDRIE